VVLKEVKLLMMKSMGGENRCWIDGVVFSHGCEGKKCVVTFDP